MNKTCPAVNELWSDIFSVFFLSIEKKRKALPVIKRNVQSSLQMKAGKLKRF